MHLCTCVSEEGDDGEAPSPETPSLLSYTLRYISFAEVGIKTQVRTDASSLIFFSPFFKPNPCVTSSPIRNANCFLEGEEGQGKGASAGVNASGECVS